MSMTSVECSGGAPRFASAFEGVLFISTAIRLTRRNKGRQIGWDSCRVGLPARECFRSPQRLVIPSRAGGEGSPNIRCATARLRGPSHSLGMTHWGIAHETAAATAPFRARY
jgi:hypothetical protein